MHIRRSVALVLLLAFAGSSGLPWLAGSHGFNDDPHWVVQLASNSSDCARLDVAKELDDDHCQVCHLQRTLRTAARPVPLGHSRIFRLVAPPATAEPGTRAAASWRPDVRGPPPSSI